VVFSQHCASAERIYLQKTICNISLLYQVLSNTVVLNNERMISQERSQEQFAQMVGERVALARKEAGLTQAELSKRLGFKDRQILSNIESGKRKVSSDELLKLMESLGRELRFFTDPLRLAGEGAFSWRAPQAEAELLDEFEERAGEWVATYRFFCRISGERFSPITPQLALTAKSSFEDAQLAAEALVVEWELGRQPILELRRKVEEELGVLVLSIAAPSGISGAACQLPQFNTILINRNEPEGRRNFDFAHELFHVLTWDRLPPRRIDGVPATKYKDKRVENLADNFAGALLMPRDSLAREWKIREELEIHDRLNDIAGVFFVTSVAVKWRCRALDLLCDADLVGIDDGRLTWNGRTNGEQRVPSLFSESFVRRLQWALDNGALSVRRAARILGLSIYEMRQLIEEYDLPVPFDL